MDFKEIRIDHLINGIRVSGGNNLVLQKDISAVLHQGMLICLLGPNGAGKSTLLRTLSGFQNPLSGKIFFSGKNLNDLNLRSRAREVAVVLTDRLNDPYLTAFEVVSMGRFPYASFYGRLKEEDVVQVEETLKLLGIFRLKDKVFHQLSDGEKQKMLLARALVQDTPFLFLDEPVAFIDSPGKIEIMQWLSEIAHQHNKGILCTTHDIELALDYADQLWLIHREKPFISGIPEDLVLKNTINNYFDRTDVAFNKYRGRFGIKNNNAEIVVNMHGNILEMQWLTRAFLRKGWEVRKVTSSNMPESYYSFQDHQFIYKTKEQKDVKFNNIEALLFYEEQKHHIRQ